MLGVPLGNNTFKVKICSENITLYFYSFSFTSWDLYRHFDLTAFLVDNGRWHQLRKGTGRILG